MLAAERTFAGWVRTGLTIIVLAIGLQALFRAAEPTWLPKAIASLFLITAILIFAAAWREAIISHRNFTNHGCTVQPIWRVSLLCALLIVGTTGTGLVLWLL